MRLVEIHPVLELALRRQSGSVAAYAARACVAALAGGLVLGVVGQTGDVAPYELGALGERMFDIVTAIIFGAVYALVAPMAVAPFVRARDTGMLEALVLTGTPESQIVRAFWWSSVLGTAAMLLSTLPLLVLAMTVGGGDGPMVMFVLVSALGCAGVLAALGLLFAVDAGGASAAGQAIITFTIIGGMASLLVTFVLRLVLPSVVKLPGFTRAPAAIVVLLVAAAAATTPAVLRAAGKRLQTQARLEPSRTMYSLALTIAPRLFRFRSTIDDPARHLLDRSAGGPLGLARGATAVAVAVAAYAWSVDRAIAVMPVVLALTATLCGAWAGAIAAEVLASRDRARDFALAGHDPGDLRQLMLRRAARVSRWPAAAFVALVAFGVQVGDIPIRGGMLACVTATGLWMFGVGYAMRMSVARRSTRSRRVLSIFLVAATLVGGAMWLSSLAAPASYLRLAHPLTLIGVLVDPPRGYWDWAGALVLASAGWSLMGLYAQETVAERLRQLFREPYGGAG